MIIRRALRIALALSVCTAFFVHGASAQESVTLQVEPPLTRVSVIPGGTWRGQLKIVNTNTSSITVSLRVADFRLTDGGRGGELLPPAETREEAKFSAARWLTLSAETIVVPPESTREFVAELLVPEDAEPGTHTAAILIGTGEGVRTPGGATVSTKVTSIVVVTVLGEIHEVGEITSLGTDKVFYGEATADISFTFVNSGNVHLEPEGEVVITNMWGRERGRVPIDARTAFDLVLPGERRDFSFQWRGDRDAFDVGPYVASVHLTFGSETAEAQTRFWVVPWAPILGVAFSLLAFIAIIALVIRAMVFRMFFRRAMTSQGSALGSIPPEALDTIRQGAVIDLRAENKKKQHASAPSLKGLAAPKRGRIGRIGIAILALIGVVGTLTFLWSGLSRPGEYRIGLYQEGREQEFLAHEELLALPVPVPGGEAILDPSPLPEETVVVYLIDISILNGSGVSGSATQLADALRSAGFTTVDAGNAETFDYERSQIQYLPGFGSIVEALLPILGGDPIIEESENLDSSNVIVIIGKDAI